MKKIFLLSLTMLSLSVTFAQTEKAKKTAEKVNPITEKSKVTKEKVTTKSKVTKLKTEASKNDINLGKEKFTTNETILEKAELPSSANELKQLNTNGVVQQAPEAPAAPQVPLQDPNKNFEFTNDSYDFGKIPAGKPAKYTLTIKNISSEPQELTLVQPGCGCTTPEYTQGQKIAKGESVNVVLGFNGGSPSSAAPFSKSVTVTLKGHNPKVVTFKGETFAVPTESAPSNNATDKLKPAGK
jgi:hypothetical protein